MQNSNASNPPSVKYHNIWAVVAAILLTLIPIGLQEYSSWRGLDAQQQVKIEEANKLIDQLKVKLKEVDNQGNQCTNDVQAINRILGTTNVMGAATGSAIKKLGVDGNLSPTPSILKVPSPTPTEVILYVPSVSVTMAVPTPVITKKP